jgi:hypothetical protein
VVYQNDFSYPTPVLSDSTYGVTPTFFAKSLTAPANLTNLTSQNLRFIEANGLIPAWMFTGDTNDTTNVLWVMRDIGAAHRVISAKEAGFTGKATGYYYDTTNSVWKVDDSGQTTWPVIDKMLTNNWGPCISFLPPTEVANIPATNILSFNGYLPFRGTFTTTKTNDYTPVITGQYTCWGFEHIMTLSTASDNVKSFASALKSAIQTNMVTSPYSIPLSKMQVTRFSTGGLVDPQ